MTDKCPHCGKDIAPKAPPDRRVFMYRQGEARMFDNPESVPEGEGWTDSPAKNPEIDVLAADLDGLATEVAEEMPDSGEPSKPRRRKKAE